MWGKKNESNWNFVEENWSWKKSPVLSSFFLDLRRIQSVYWLFSWKKNCKIDDINNDDEKNRKWIESKPLLFRISLCVFNHHWVEKLEPRKGRKKSNRLFSCFIEFNQRKSKELILFPFLLLSLHLLSIYKPMRLPQFQKAKYNNENRTQPIEQKIIKMKIMFKWWPYDWKSMIKSKFSNNNIRWSIKLINID